jgi:predicted phage terminase large subunit-like protein
VERSGQTAPDVWIEQQLDLIAKWKPLLWVREAGQIRRAVEPFLVKRSRQRGVFCRLEWLANISEKPVRARGFQARASAGCVYLPKTIWADDLLSQLLRFPSGALDDNVDVCSLLGRALNQTVRGFLPPKEEKKKPRDSWAFAFGDYDEETGSWKTA